MPNLEGKTLKWRYQVEGLIGRGGMAEVYRAFDSQRQSTVAIKVMREDLAEDLEFLGRFQLEAQALAALSHPNIVRFYSFERDGPLAFIVMDHIRGITLRRRIMEAGGVPLPLEEALSIIQQICAALHYAHQAKVLHRDIKPGNIMIQPAPPGGTAGHVLVADFGIAKAADVATATAVTPGTPAYMSPEQCRNQPTDARADVYSAGVVAYEMLTGRRPFVGDRARVTTGGTREKIRWEQIHAQPLPMRPWNPAVPCPLEEAVLGALVKEPARRWPDIRTFWQQIALATGRPVSLTGPATAEEPPPPPLESKAPPQKTTGALPTRPAGGQISLPVSRLAKLPPWAWVLIGLVLAGLILLIASGGGGAANGTPLPTRAPPPTRITATPASSTGLEPGYYSVGKSMRVNLICSGQPFGTMQLSVEGVEVLSSGQLRFEVSYLWAISNAEKQNCPDFQLTINSDQTNTNMYLTDQNGVRYDHIQVGGRAAVDKTMAPNTPERGWFLFPQPRQGARVFAFHDDDNGTAISNIDLGP